jgi:hypothetical protein
MKRAFAGAVCSVMLITTAACSGNPNEATTGSSGSPLAEYLGDGGGLSTNGRAVSVQGDDPDKQQQVQELIAACMKEAGFEYLPYVPTAPEPQPVLEGDLDWARTYGYGISTIDATAPDPSDDPNTAITAAMSESERAAYQRALFGTSFQSTTSIGGAVAAAPPVGIAPPSGGADGSTVPPTGAAENSPGCVPQASAQVYGEPDVVDMQEFSTLFDALSKLQTSVMADPRVVPLIAVWSDCMADAGHPGFTAVDDARNSIMSRWADLNGWQFTPGEGGGGSVSVSSADQVTEPDPAKVAELRTDEIALAVADLGCRTDHQAVYDQVRTELEQKFVDEHRSELERYRDATSGGN